MAGAEYLLVRRRDFLALAAAAGSARAAADGWVLVHEHVMVDFVGADEIRPGRYDADEVFRAARPKLAALRALGCTRLQECTPNYLGRDPRLMARLADATGLEIWSRTGGGRLLSDNQGVAIVPWSPAWTARFRRR